MPATAATLGLREPPHASCESGCGNTNFHYDPFGRRIQKSGPNDHEYL